MDTNEVVKIWSKKLDIPEKKLTEVINLLSKSQLAFQNPEGKNFLYPKTGDSQRTCPLMNAMFYIEHRKGIILFLPSDRVKKEGDDDKQVWGDNFFGG